MAITDDSNKDSERGSLPVSQLATASDLQNKLETLERGRSRYDRQWKLNLAFYKGNQYSYYPKNSFTMQSLPVEDGDKPRYRSRIVSNQIIQGAQSLLSKYTKTKPVMSATPGSGSDGDVKAAQLAERLLEYWWSDLHLEDRLQEALLWGIIAGQGYWKITWDAQAGKSMRFLLAPDGEPIIDESVKDAFRGELMKYGIPPQEQVVYMGDIKVETMSPFNVLIDPNARTFGEAKYAFCKHFLDPDEVLTRWGVQMRADSYSTSPDQSMLFDTKAKSNDDRTTIQVNLGYFLPNAALPNGRYVAWTKTNKKILEDGPWPYPSAELPFVKFPGVAVPGDVYDGSVVEQGIPEQKELNRTLSQIVEYKNMMIRPRVWAPVGSMRTRYTNEPAVVMEYNPINNLKPEPEQLPSLPPYVFEHLNNISGRLKEVFSLTEVTEGSVPPNVEAGLAIDLLQEMATDRLAPTIRRIEFCLERAGNLMLGLAQQYYQEPRLLKIKGSGGSFQVKRFTQADLNAGVSITVESGSGLPRTRAGRMMMIQQYMQMGVISPDEAYKHVELADTKSVAAKWGVDEDLAYREHEKLMTRTPLNPEAIQEAMSYLQMGVNPETMEPLTGQPMEAENIMRRASLKPGLADIHPVHLDIHGRFMKSMEFDGIGEEIRQDFIWHYQLTLEAMQGLPQPEPTSPKVNLQLKSTVGPTAQSKILQAAGVDVSAEDSSEPPLETWISDSVDKPDVDASGPGQEGANLSKVAKELLDAEIAEMKAKQESQQSAELHKHNKDKAEADAALARKKALQSNFKPKKE